jgi:iron complex outermembrane receptor protein
VQAGDNFFDYANTFKVPSYEIYGIEGSYDISEEVTLFIEGRNLTDEGFVQNYATIADASLEGVNTNLFVPGEGRAVYGGIRIGFGR